MEGAHRGQTDKTPTQLPKPRSSLHLLQARVSLVSHTLVSLSHTQILSHTHTLSLTHLEPQQRAEGERHEVERGEDLAKVVVHGGGVEPAHPPRGGEHHTRQHEALHAVGLPPAPVVIIPHPQRLPASGQWMCRMMMLTGDDGMRVCVCVCMCVCMCVCGPLRQVHRRR